MRGGQMCSELSLLKGSHQALVHSDQMVLMMARRGWTALTVVKDAQRESWKKYNRIPEGLLGTRCRVAEVTCAYKPRECQPIRHNYSTLYIYINLFSKLAP